MAERVRRIEEETRQIERREYQKTQNLTIPVDLWLQSGLEEGGILIVHQNRDLRRRLASILTRRGYKVRAVDGGREAQSALRKSSYSLIIVHWGIFQRSSDLVSLLRKSFPRTRLIITSPNFAWPSENSVRAQRGMEALEAGAYAYMPDQYIRSSIETCVETTLSSNMKACPVLMSGMACNQKCFI